MANSNANATASPQHGQLHNQISGTVLDGMQPGATPLEFVTQNISAKRIDDSSTVLIREEQPQPGEFNTLVENAIDSVRKSHGLEQPNGKPETRSQENPRHVEAFSFEPVSEAKSGEGEARTGDQSQSQESERTDPETTDEPPTVTEATEDEQALAAEAQKNPKGPAASIVNLRKQVKHATDKLTEANNLLAVRTKELEQYRTGEIVPERITELQKRVEQLEPFEHLHNFRLSPEYHERYTKPLQQLTAEARQLAKDYAVDPKILDTALKLGNVRELNAHLSKYFQDPVGAMQARELVMKIRNVAVEMNQAEKQPQEKLEHLRREARQIEEQELHAREQKLVEDTKLSWGDSIRKLTANNQFPELTIREGDEQHNAYVRPLITQAAQEFGKVIKVLAHYGLKDVPTPILVNLAQRFALSQVAAVSGLSRDQHAARAERVIENAKRTQPLLRPPIGGSTSGANGTNHSSSEARVPMTPESAADTILENVLNRRT